MTPQQQALLLELEIARRRKQQLISPTEQLPWPVALERSLFRQQHDFVFSPAKAKIAQCTRRAGKTHACAALLLKEAYKHPGSTALYLALTRGQAKQLLWSKLKAINAAYNIGLKFNEADLIATLQNGSKIVLYGADQENIAERLRGDAYCVVIFDEAASFGAHLDYVIEDVVEPALLDFDGILAMVGTPGPVLAGPFYEACTDPTKGWDVHRWSVLDNTKLPHAAKWIGDLKRRRNWDDGNPTYLREYCNVWTEDPDALVYKFIPGRNVFAELPEGIDWSYVLGIDLGYRDSAAWSVVAYSQDYPKAFGVHSERHAGWIPAQWATLTKTLMTRFNPDEIVVDCGALGLAIAMEFQERYEIPCEAAEKSEKMAFIELVNGDFREDRFAIHESLLELQGQYRALVKDKKGLKEHPALPNDMCDSMLYAYRKARHYFYAEADIEPEYGSEEYWKREETLMLERMERDWKKQQNQEWFDGAA